ncbi:MAG: hypothetical protein KatS3mg105_0257 [Gemmatales bacterium]|nr:MAG: hypothetical protein KatS3mg105_0257 [Gemmatales bacterium]
MGQPATTIQIDDFHVPVELKSYSLTGGTVGRIGGVRMEIVPGANGTALGRCYQQVPLHIVPPFALHSARTALFYLQNPTNGIMDGDAHLLDITARSGTFAMLTSQSATRIHPAVNSFATQQWRIHVESGAVLVVLPGPAIPFRGCRFYQEIRVSLEPQAGLIWGDLWLAGRYARGALSEQHVFDCIIQDLCVERERTPVFRDRFCWRGPWDRSASQWHVGGKPASASIFVSAPQSILPPPLAGAASFPTGANDTCLRLVGDTENCIAFLVQTAFAAANAIAGRDLFTVHDANLAPVHWFSVAE